MDWGPNCPICINIEEDWDGDKKNQQFPQQNIPSTQTLSAHSSHHRKISNTQRHQTSSNHRTSSTPNLVTYLICYAEQIHLRKEWDGKMERLNDKYGLDYYFKFWIRIELGWRRTKIQNVDMKKIMKLWHTQIFFLMII